MRVPSFQVCGPRVPLRLSSEARGGVRGEGEGVGRRGTGEGGWDGEGSGGRAARGTGSGHGAMRGFDALWAEAQVLHPWRKS